MTDNITPMPGVQLPHQIEEQAAQKASEENAQLVTLIEELLKLVKEGQVAWVAIAGEFANGQKMAAFGNIGKGDALRVVGSIEWLKAEYMAAFRASPP